jgi:hypothetical protein
MIPNARPYTPGRKDTFGLRHQADRIHSRSPTRRSHRPWSALTSFGGGYKKRGNAAVFGAEIGGHAPARFRFVDADARIRRQWRRACDQPACMPRARLRRSGPTPGRHLLSQLLNANAAARADRI